MAEAGTKEEIDLTEREFNQIALSGSENENERDGNENEREGPYSEVRNSSGDSPPRAAGKRDDKVTISVDEPAASRDRQHQKDDRHNKSASGRAGASGSGSGSKGAKLTLNNLNDRDPENILTRDSKVCCSHIYN